MTLPLIPPYLLEPLSIEKALLILDKHDLQGGFEDSYKKIESALGIQNRQGFPISVVTVGGVTCRARVNSKEFPVAYRVSEIGVKANNISQGRANAAGYPIFYGANCKRTAAFEVLQDKPAGRYIVTIGCWESESGLSLANFVDGSDPDFSKISFVHSFPNRYLSEWPEVARQSAAMIIKYFSQKFKMPHYPGLYDITNIIAGFCFSLENVDGIGYGSISDNFSGYNIAIKNPAKLRCVSVERWLILKSPSEILESKKLQDGVIQSDGTIFWKMPRFQSSEVTQHS